ncbi:MAG: hydrolase [Candidatus Limnocylindrales bacterium]|jgi:nicotinamidase-related amidase
MELKLEPSRTALVVIDLQRGIVALPAGPRSAPEVVARAAQLVKAMRAKGGTVVLVHVTSSPDGRDGLAPITDAPVRVGAGRSLPPEWSEFVPELKPEISDIVITKRQWGAFYGTELDLQLRRRGVDTIVLCGISTSIGVESTARDAFERGYQQVFVEDAMADREADEHRHTANSLFPRIGRIRSTAEVLAALK